MQLMHQHRRNLLPAVQQLADTEVLTGALGTREVRMGPFGIKCLNYMR
jgi:hypothetical protein